MKLNSHNFSLGSVSPNSPSPTRQTFEIVLFNCFPYLLRCEFVDIETKKRIIELLTLIKQTYNNLSVLGNDLSGAIEAYLPSLGRMPGLSESVSNYFGQYPPTLSPNAPPFHTQAQPGGSLHRSMYVTPDHPDRFHGTNPTAHTHHSYSFSGYPPQPQPQPQPHNIPPQNHPDPSSQISQSIPAFPAYPFQ